MAHLDFWYCIGSTYTYLTVMRLAEAAGAAEVSITWRPYNVRSVMVAQNNIPFKGKPEKTAYMWRDIQRRAGKYGFTAKTPAPYPLEHLERANRVALLGMREGWGIAFTVESYRQWFQDGLPAGAEPNLTESLVRAGADPANAIDAAKSEEIGAALAAETHTAQSLGVFGAPSFVVGSEVFWGDDRLEDALSWAKHCRL